MQRHAAAQPGVTRVTRHAELQVLAVRQPEMLPLLLRGVDLESDARISELVVDREPGLRNLGDGVMLGQLVAQQLGVTVGDSITLLVPALSAGGVPEARLRELRVVAIFEAGIQDHDATLAFASLGTLADLGAGRVGDRRASICRSPIPCRRRRLPAALRQSLAAAGLDGLEVRDWTQDHASYFRAIRIEKTMMALILLLVVAVAAFNIVAMLVMVVTDKRTDIAILRTLGAGPGRVASIFVAQGAIVGFAGVAAGVLLGVGLASNVDHGTRTAGALVRHHAVRCGCLCRHHGAVGSAWHRRDADRRQRAAGHAARHVVSRTPCRVGAAGRSPAV